MSRSIPKLSRRAFGADALMAAAAVAALDASAQCGGTGATPIHCTEQEVAFPVVAYIFERPEGLVVVDALLTDLASKELRAEVGAIGKPLQAALLAHPHPDHYAGLGNLVEALDAPTFAVPGVNDVVRRDDAAKDALISGMFGPEWPTNRSFPTETVIEGSTLDYGPGLSFQVTDIGPAESFHDSVFVLEAEASVAFVCDRIFSLKHAYMSDVQNSSKLAAIDQPMAKMAEDTLLFVGYGMPATPALLQWQKTYL